jgi:hypothetical protein
MQDVESETCGGAPWGLPRWLGYCLILGLYLTLRGYHSLDGDQAYRLPLLLHQQDPAVFACDPFVTAFGAFNPHRGSLLLLGWVTGPLGLSLGLLLVFVVIFLATCRGIDLLAREVWPERAGSVGWVAIILVLTAKAGNIGTNHLFEAMVLDRLMALAAGWVALAAVIGRPSDRWRSAAIALGLATLIHPSLGLQLALLVAGSWIGWAAVGGRTQVSRALAVKGLAANGLAVLPGLALNLLPGGSFHEGLSSHAFWALSVELQNPQHMLPHLWRMPQWLAWGCYLLLALLALKSAMAQCAGRIRLLIMIGLVLFWLGGAWEAIEVLHHLRITLFQPFRMATVARGLCLMLIAGRLVHLWSRGGAFPRIRAVLLGIALAGDWMLVAVTLAELGATMAERQSERLWVSVYAGLLTCGLLFLSRHDTESGHWPIVAGLCAGLAVHRMPWSWLRERTAPGWAMALAWAVPVLALAAGAIPANCPLAQNPLVRGLAVRCRFVPVPGDDIERLALWCREHTPPEVRFVGPPGPKTFRLWSRRSLAFNRSGSPYHAAGLADWFARFQDHVGLHVPPQEFVREYQAGRHELEARYDTLSGDELASLAVRQGADHVIAPVLSTGREGRLTHLHTEGCYAVYRLAAGDLAQRQR